VRKVLRQSGTVAHFCFRRNSKNREFLFVAKSVVTFHFPNGFENEIRFVYTSPLTSRTILDESNQTFMSEQENVTRLLLELSNGDDGAVGALLPVVYDELKRLAANYLRRERGDHTLQPTALVHEAYIKLIDQTRVSWQNRAHFFGIAAQIMRRILIDHARQHKADKRSGEINKLQLDENIDKAVEMSSDLVALDEALNDLAKVDAQLAKLVELRYFGGLTFEETAEVLGISSITAKRHWKLAQAWLYGQLNRT
jgi:RNA polymerase sigma factor (TIGR02999 family)